MKLLVILLCLFSERFLIHTISYKRFYWFPEYYQKLKKSVERNRFFANPWALLSLLIIPILLTALFVYLFLYHIMFGFMGMLMGVVIFFYCLGPDNVFYPVVHDENKNNIQLVGDYFVKTERQIFSLIFWYIIAGPIGALAYRLITICCELNAVSEQANEITNLMEWIPVRLTVLFFLLVGNFQQGYSLFIKLLFAKPNVNKEMLRECGLLAVRKNETDDPSMIEAELLVEHALFAVLVLIAVFTLISWL